MKEDIINFLMERLQEPSTWRGVIWLITALGFALDPDQRESIVTTGMAFVGLIGVFTKDKKKEVIQEQQQKTEEAVIEYKKTTPDPNKPKKPVKPKVPKGKDKDNFFNDK